MKKVNIFDHSFQKVKPIYYIDSLHKVKYFKPLFLEILMIILKHCDILNRNVQLLKSMFISMHSILGWASFCMNYCINAAWHGVNQSVALLRCNGSPGCFDSSLQVICFVGSGVSHLPLDNTP